MDIGNIKITMVGKSGTGKTTFNAGLYQKLIQSQIDGFCFRPRQQASVNSAKIDDALEQIERFRENYKRMIEEREFPNGTGELQNWKLDFYNHEHKLSTIEWIDYKGGVLEDFNVNDGQFGTVLKTIMNSHGLLCFIDAYRLTSIDSLQEASEQSGASVIKLLLAELNRTAPNVDLAIALVLTKCDGIERKYQSNGSFNALLNRCERIFEDMKSIFARQSNWNCALIPVSSVGLGKTERTNKKSSGFSLFSSTSATNEPVPSQASLVANEFEIVEFPDAYNVEVPFFYCIHHIMKSCVINKGKINDIVLRVRQHEEYLKNQRKIFFKNPNLKGVYSDYEDFLSDKRELEWINQSISKWQLMSSRNVRTLSPIQR